MLIYLISLNQSQITNYKLQITNYKLQITNYKLQITSTLFDGPWCRLHR
jgi:hypothetical protein